MSPFGAWLLVAEQLHYITNREEIFDFSNKKCRIYAACSVSQTPRLKHDKKEMFGMCKAVEDYANKRAKEYAEKQSIKIYIEATMKYSGLPEDKIIEEVVNRFNITEEEAKEYYDECSFWE